MLASALIFHSFLLFACATMCLSIHQSLEIWVSPILAIVNKAEYEYRPIFCV